MRKPSNPDNADHCWLLWQRSTTHEGDALLMFVYLKESAAREDAKRLTKLNPDRQFFVSTTYAYHCPHVGPTRSSCSA